MATPTEYTLEVNPSIPPRLARLEELANNLYYSWDRATRALFARLHPPLWDAVGHSPKAMLKRVDEQRLEEAAEDPSYLSAFNRVLSAYDSYHSAPLRRNGAEWLQQDDLVAYFCAEFGFHESLPIYSGGLGILAGDHCKAASDLRLPFVGIGLLYRQGYFFQTIDSEGNQQSHYEDSDFDDLPVTPVLQKGQPLRVQVALPGRTIDVQVWQTRIGHVTLYLLDTDLESNSERDRDIAHQLYGGDRTTRIEQEIVLGVGGARALAALDLRPTVWHINEGHAAFLVLERIRGAIKQGLDFQTALEAVAVNTVFTTHTPVPAGHDLFAEEMIMEYFESYCAEVGVDHEHLLALGRTSFNPAFNMTVLGVRGSRYHNGVSRIHGGVSAHMLEELWPQVPATENPMSYITNGVHAPTFVAPEWNQVFEPFLAFDWSNRLEDVDMWERLMLMPDHIYWGIRLQLKAQMLHLVRHRVRRQHFRHHGSEAHLDRLLRLVDPDAPNVLTIGFGRRFATYKRATLLFENLDLLHRIVSDPEKPVLIIFAGKAHPADVPGQELIRRVSQVARMPEFEGHILLLEGYDMRLARRLVAGVDVWLNNPVHPLEASGTSGMKAGMNGVLNLSVLDGWWGEGYDGDNGWAIKPVAASEDDAARNRQEAQMLYETLQDRVVPLYYDRDGMSYSAEWVRMSKRAMASILPRYNATRMVNEYVAKFYLPASQRGRLYAEDGSANAKLVARWKAKVRAAWPNINIFRLDTPKRRIRFGERERMEVAVYLDGLSPQDVTVEAVLTRGLTGPQEQSRVYVFSPDGTRTDSGAHRFVLDLQPELCGRLDYRIRVYPSHELLTHPFELGLMLWV